jgi:hypothetical protein
MSMSSNGFFTIFTMNNSRIFVKIILALTLCFVSLAPQGSSAQSDANSLCAPVLDKAKLFISYECHNDSLFLVTDKLDSGWHYAFDQGFDGTGNGRDYELYGMAFREFADEIWIVVNGNMPLAGYPLNVQGGSIGHSDLFIDLSDLSFADASLEKKLYAVRYSSTNDSSAPKIGVYKNVKAKAVGSINAGYATLLDYKNTVGTALGLGDLPNNQSYYADNIGLNEIEEGEFLGDITFLTPADLTSVGYDLTTYAGKIHVALLVEMGPLVLTVVESLVELQFWINAKYAVETIQPARIVLACQMVLLKSIYVVCAVGRTPAARIAPGCQTVMPKLIFAEYAMVMAQVAKTALVFLMAALKSTNAVFVAEIIPPVKTVLAYQTETQRLTRVGFVEEMDPPASAVMALQIAIRW